MAYSLKIGQFAKKINSTAQPNTTGWATFDVVLKNNTNLINPIITLNAKLEDIQNYNYANIFNRYYFIKNINIARTDFLEIELEEDVLATYKTEIGNTSLYILRSANSFDGNIFDNFYPQTFNKSTSAIAFDDYPGVDWSGGYYVVNVAGQNTTASNTLYQFTPSNFAKFVGQLMGSIDSYQQGISGDWAGVVESINNTLFQPMEYLNSVMWFPKYFPGIDPGTPLYLGKWQSGIAHTELTSSITTLYSKSFTLPKHPKASIRGDYLNGAPFSEYILSIEPFGTINLDSAQIAKSNNLYINSWIDAFTGVGYLNCFSDDSTILASLTAQIGVPVGITSHQYDPGTVATVLGGLGTMALGAAGAIPAVAAISSIANAGIQTAAGAIRGVASTIGNTGSIMAGAIPKAFTATFYDVVDDDLTNNGRPLCAISTPANIEGFIVAQKAPLNIAAEIDELIKIENYLTTGFYYE